MIELVPVSQLLAVAVTSYGDIDAALDRPRLPDWPHDDTADAFRPLAEHHADTQEGTFLVVHEGVVIGDCGWFGPPLCGELGIRRRSAPSARRQGHGTEAVAALLAWVGRQGATTVRAEVQPGNEASLRLLARLGFAVVGGHAGYVVLTRTAR